MAKMKTVTAPNVGEDAQKLDRANIVGRNVKWYSHSGKQFDSSRLKMNLADNPAMALFGIYPRETNTLFSLKNLYTNVYRSFIQTTQMPFNG